MSLIYCYIADLLFGDPEWFPHPVRGIGRVIAFLDNRLRGEQSRRNERMKGVFVTFSTVGISAFCAWGILEGAVRLSSLAGSIVWIYLGYTTISVKDLFIKAKAVLEEVEAGSLFFARNRLSQIVGRDTQKLSKEGVIKAAIESIAENTNDGIIAPLFYLILGGPVAGIAYKAVNTLDSMIGYKNEKYFYFGWFSAKLDDAANFIPARITGLLIASASFVLGKSFRNSFIISSVISSTVYCFIFLLHFGQCGIPIRAKRSLI